MADASAKQVLFEPIFSNNPIALQILVSAPRWR